MERTHRVETSELDDHAYWDVNFVANETRFWTQGPGDDWSFEAFPLRRAGDHWEYYREEEIWKRDVARLRENLGRMGSGSSFHPPDVQEWNRQFVAMVEQQLEAALKVGPGWNPFSDELNASIEEAWADQGEAG